MDLHRDGFLCCSLYLNWDATVKRHNCILLQSLSPVHISLARVIKKKLKHLEGMGTMLRELLTDSLAASEKDRPALFDTVSNRFQNIQLAVH